MKEAAALCGLTMINGEAVRSNNHLQSDEDDPLSFTQISHSQLRFAVPSTPHSLSLAHCLSFLMLIL